jgi:carbonic anhydrase
MVRGHANCGAVAATIKGFAVPGQISVLYPHIQPAVELAGPNVEAAIKSNGKLQAAILAEGSTVISGLVKDHRIKVLAGVLRCSEWKGNDGWLDAQSDLFLVQTRKRL